MGRRTHIRKLAVWMNGELTGHWTLPAGNGAMEFAYSPKWLESPSARAISLSMPLTPTGGTYREPVGPYFDNLLPDNRAIRERIQRRFHTDSVEPFDLLSEIGRDCVGAIQLLPEGEIPVGIQKIEGETVTPVEIGRILSGMLSSPIGREQAKYDDAFRISLAGAQEKTAFLWHEGEWRIPQASDWTEPRGHRFKYLRRKRMALLRDHQRIQGRCGTVSHGFFRRFQGIDCGTF